MSLRSGKTYDILSLGAQTSVTEVFSGVIDVEAYSEANVLLRVTNDGGTNPTVTLKLWTRGVGVDDLWYLKSTIVNALAVANASVTDILNSYAITNFGRKIRIGITIGGTDTPTATMSLLVIAKT